MNLLEELQEQLGLTYLVIAHDLAVVRHISDTVGVMYLGRAGRGGAPRDLYTEPLHPYTRALMSAVPVPDPEVEDRRERILLAGDLPSPANPPSGCRFHTRCPWGQPTRCARAAGAAGGPARSRRRCLPLGRADRLRHGRRGRSRPGGGTGPVSTDRVAPAALGQQGRPDRGGGRPRRARAAAVLVGQRGDRGEVPVSGGVLERAIARARRVLRGEPPRLRGLPWTSPRWSRSPGGVLLTLQEIPYGQRGDLQDWWPP